MIESYHPSSSTADQILNAIFVPEESVSPEHEITGDTSAPSGHESPIIDPEILVKLSAMSQTTWSSLCVALDLGFNSGKLLVQRKTCDIEQFGGAAKRARVVSNLLEEAEEEQFQTIRFMPVVQSNDPQEFVECIDLKEIDFSKWFQDMTLEQLLKLEAHVTSKPITTGNITSWMKDYLKWHSKYAKLQDC